VTGRPNPQAQISGLPWSTRSQWQEINASIQVLYQRHRCHFEEYLRPTATRIYGRLNAINSLLDQMCRISCPQCPAPCCLSAKIWFDLKDLLLIHLLQAPLPVCQPLQHRTNICRNLSPKGCTLPRLIRPWICTWYLCPTQMKIIRSAKDPEFMPLPQQIDFLKQLRKQLEADFIRLLV
jgi:hypothetical protein